MFVLLSCEKSFKLNFSVSDKACWSAMQVHLTHCVVKSRIDTIPKREDTSRRVNLLRELLHVVSIILTNS